MGAWHELALAHFGCCFDRCGAVVSTHHQQRLGQRSELSIAAATFSLLLSAITVFVLFCLNGAPTQASQLLQLPWWAVFGGLFGAAFVSGGIILVPIMGATIFFLCLIAGQLVGSVVADTIGAFELEPQALTLRKLAGVMLAFCGVVLVRWG